MRWRCYVVETSIYGVSQSIINGRTLYKDGYWNTLCLPFDLRDFTGTPLEGAEVRTLDISSLGNTGFDRTTGTLTLDFMEIDEVFAGNPFIVRWGTPENPGGEDNIVNPVFAAVRVENVDPAQCGYKIKQLVEFGGTFKPENFKEHLNYFLYLGDNNKLYYPPNEGFKVNAFRAYFKLLGSLFAGTPESQVKDFVLNFGDESTTGILGVSEQSVKSDNWYSLDGIRLSEKPCAKGIYINNGRKVVIK